MAYVSFMGQQLQELSQLQDAFDQKKCLSLNLSNNCLQSLHDVPTACCLTELDLSSNRLGALELAELANFSALVTLNLSSNQLQNLEVLPFMPTLQILDVSHNNLKSLSGIQAISFNLISLDVRGNNLSNIDDAIANVQLCPRLQELSLQTNPMTSRTYHAVFKSCSSLKMINGKSANQWKNDEADLSVDTPLFDRLKETMLLHAVRPELVGKVPPLKSDSKQDQAPFAPTDLAVPSIVSATSDSKSPNRAVGDGFDKDRFAQDTCKLARMFIALLDKERQRSEAQLIEERMQTVKREQALKVELRAQTDKRTLQEKQALARHDMFSRKILGLESTVAAQREELDEQSRRLVLAQEAADNARTELARITQERDSAVAKLSQALETAGEAEEAKLAVAVMRESINACRCEEAELRERLQLAAADHAAVLDELLVARKCAEDTESTVRVLQSDNDALQLEVADLKQRLSHSEELLAVATEKCAALNCELDATKNLQDIQIAADLREKTVACERLAAEVVAAQSRGRSVEDALNAEVVARNRAESRLAQAVATLDKLSGKYRVAMKERDQQEADLVAAHREAELLRRDVVKLQEQVEVSRRRAEKFVDIGERLSRELTALQQEHALVVAQHSDCQATVIKLRDENRSLGEKCAAALATSEGYQVTLVERQQQNLDLKARADRLEVDCGMKARRLEEVSEEVRGLSRDLRGAREERMDLEEALDRLQLKLQQAAEDVRQLRVDKDAQRRIIEAMRLQVAKATVPAPTVAVAAPVAPSSTGRLSGSFGGAGDAFAGLRLHDSCEDMSFSGVWKSDQEQ